MGNRAVGPAPTPEGGYRLPPLIAVVAVLVGATLYFALSRWLGVSVEEWQGVNTFTSPKWFAATVVLPVLTGFVTGVIAGPKGKWYAILPLLLIHPADYFQLAASAGTQVVVLGYGLFVFFMIIMMELALMAGWGGELLRARMAGKDVRA